MITIARIGGLLLLALVACCQGLAKAAPGDPPLRFGTIARYDDGTLRKGYLKERAEVEGFPCKRWLHYYPGGKLKGFELARDTVIQGHPLPAGTVVWLDEQGRLETCWLSRNTALQGLLCDGGFGKVATSFHPNGHLRSLYLTSTQEIEGLPCKAGVFAPVRLHDSGSLAGCTLARDALWRGQQLPRGAEVRLDPDGELVSPR
jgi:hypothetical protein